MEALKEQTVRNQKGAPPDTPRCTTTEGKKDDEWCKKTTVPCCLFCSMIFKNHELLTDPASKYTALLITQVY